MVSASIYPQHLNSLSTDPHNLSLSTASVGDDSLAGMSVFRFARIVSRTSHSWSIVSCNPFDLPPRLGGVNGMVVVGDYANFPNETGLVNLIDTWLQFDRECISLRSVRKQIVTFACLEC